VYHVSH
jgi:hypothetical protein